MFFASVDVPCVLCHRSNFYILVCRIAKENRLFAGVWYGCAKPDMGLFLQPLAMSLKSSLWKVHVHTCVGNLALFLWLQTQLSLSIL